MMIRPLIRWIAVAPAILLTACGARMEQFERPEEVRDFTALYQNNCRGCHGPDGRRGAARPLNNPVFLAVIGNQQLRSVITEGVPNTPMPAFSKSAGGDLTDQQIAILADGIVEHWSRPQAFLGVVLPPYRGDLGDAQAGAASFKKYCARCHGDGERGPIPGVADPSFLALASNQLLRSTVVAGREGMPDWRDHRPSLSANEIADIVAWLASHRPEAVTLTERGQLP